MADPKQIDDRLDRLEEKLKVTFNAIEKKFDEVDKHASATPVKISIPAGVQPHKMTEFEERFAKLEEKLKLTFNEIEKRFAQMQQQPHYNVEDRIEELEDLLLLLQLESTKIREKVGDGLDFGLVPSTPDISERITRLESELAATPSLGIAADNSLDIKMSALEEKINSIKPVVQTSMDESTKEAIRNLENKVKTLEALLAQRGRQELEEDDLLADVKNILRR